MALKGEIDESTSTDGVLSTPLSDTDNPARTQVNSTTPLINWSNQLDNYKPLYQTAVEYTLC